MKILAMILAILFLSFSTVIAYDIQLGKVVMNKQGNYLWGSAEVQLMDTGNQVASQIVTSQRYQKDFPGAYEKIKAELKSQAESFRIEQESAITLYPNLKTDLEKDLNITP